MWQYPVNLRSNKETRWLELSEQKRVAGFKFKEIAQDEVTKRVPVECMDLGF